MEIVQPRRHVGTIFGHPTVGTGTIFSKAPFSARSLTYGVGLFENVGTAIGQTVGGAMNVLLAVGAGAVIGYFGARLSVGGKKRGRRR